MPETKTSGLAYLPGEDPEAVAANAAYQEALRKLTESLDQRKGRFFDPVYLAAAQGFLAPGAPDFFESLGRVAGNVGKARKEEEAEERDIAQQRLNVATQGMELQRQKMADREFARLAGEYAGETPRRDGALPGRVEGEGALPAGPKPQEDLGIQIAPPDPSRLTGRQYLQMSRFDRATSPAQKLEKAAEIDSKNIVVREGGQFNIATGRFYPIATGKTVEIEIFGYPGTYSVNERDAAILNSLAAQGDAEGYRAHAKKVIEGPFAKGAVVAPSAPAAPTAAAPEGRPAETAAERRKSVQEREEEKRQREIEQTEATRRATKLGEISGEREANLPNIESSARSTIASTQRLQKLLDASPNAFGIFSNPTLTSAFGKLIQEGIQTPKGSLNFGGFEEAVLRAMPRIKKQDLDNYRRAVAELSEIELGYTQTYMKGQGAITEGERKIVGTLGGKVSDSAPMIRSRSELIQARAQYEVDAVNAFRRWQDKNPGKSYLEFERKSDELKELKNTLDKKASNIYDKYLAPKTSAGTSAGQAAPGKGQDLKAARDALDKLINR